ncbi:MAG: hypothetical protein IPO90_12110 [Flavobacteriales bacterium]|nr:hypothetical protein [Flavobacteriales bacterium]
MLRTLRNSFLLALLAIPASLSAQTTWWGMTASGGASGVGTIYSITEANVFTKKYDFTRFEGGSPKGDVIKASNGLYYGVTEFGGTAGVGVLYSYNPSTGAYTVLVNFSTSTSAPAIGARPYRGLMQAANGKLYGTCSQGGVNNVGTLFEYVIGGALTKRVDFDALSTAASKGSTPRCRLMQASNGLIYGVTQLGGVNNRGVLYQFNTSTNVFTKRFDFTAFPSLTGGQPFGGLTAPASGTLLYGITQSGGANVGGVIYSFNTANNAYTAVYDFTQATGRFPLGEMVLAPNGSLYGTTTAGGTNNLGVIFSYDPVTDTYTNRFNLTSVSGSSPFARMILGSNGLLYGTADQGGLSNAGTIFSFNTTTNALSVVYNLSDGGFSDPWAGVIEDPAGTLVGVANDGGTGNEGALFKVLLSSGVDTELVPFGFSNGSTPKGRLLKASNGLFYGLTSTGGTENTGILFSFDPVTSTFVRLVNFTNATFGTFPLGTLVESGGKLYGLCSGGGTANGGTLFEYTISTNTCVKKKDIALQSAGTVPQNGLFKAGNGTLYGNTSVGSTNGQGALFSYVASTNAFTKLFDFTVASGSQPLGDLTQASNGLLYGTCSGNGQFGKGSLYSWNPGTSVFTTLYSFDGFQGGVPAGEVLDAGNGKLYGTFREDGQGFSGGIFTWEIATSIYNEEYSFNIAPVTTDGKLSESNLIKGTDGLLYGTATQGGSGDLGVLFRYNPTTPALTTLQTFAGISNGQYPFDGLASETLPATNVSLNAKVFLEGPFNSGTGTMNNTLRTLTGGNGFPTTEPFTSAGFTIVGGGGETINPTVLATTGNNAVVDWVLLELRDKNTPATILRTKAMLLQSDGDIVDTDNSSAPAFPLGPDNYYVAVRQRNHFGVMTSAAVALSGTPVTVDFTSPAQGNFGTNAQKTIGAVRACWAGNVVRNSTIQYVGANNDRDPILVRVGSTVPTNVVTGYFAEDVNLDGNVLYVGAGNDRDPILVNVGGTTPNNTFNEQLP